MKLTPTHVFNVSDLSHSAVPLCRVDDTDRTPVKFPDRRPIVERYLYAESGKLTFTHTHGLHLAEIWRNSVGEVLEWSDVPEIKTVESFKRNFEGASFRLSDESFCYA
jgi:hypothetical protein